MKFFKKIKKSNSMVDEIMGGAKTTFRLESLKETLSNDLDRVEPIYSRLLTSYNRNTKTFEKLALGKDQVLSKEEMDLAYKVLYAHKTQVDSYEKTVKDLSEKLESVNSIIVRIEASKAIEDNLSQIDSLLSNNESSIQSALKSSLPNRLELEEIERSAVRSVHSVSALAELKTF